MVLKSDVSVTVLNIHYKVLIIVDGMKKIDDLTTGVLYTDYIESLGLTVHDAMYIREQLISDYQGSIIDTGSVESHLMYLVDELLVKKGLPAKYNFSDKNEKLLTYNYNQDHTTWHCKNCNHTILYNDLYCYNCGNRTNFNPDNNRIKSDSDNCSDKAFTGYDDTGLLFAVVTFLLQVKRNDIHDVYQLYNLSMKPVINYALEMNYVMLCDDREKYYNVLEDYSELELKVVLINHNLDSHGEKSDLIKRIINNIDNNILSTCFNTITYTLTNKGMDLINKNPHIDFYNKFLTKYSYNEYNRIYHQNKETQNISQTGIQLTKNYQQQYKEKHRWKSYQNTFLTQYNIYSYIKNSDEKIKSLLKIYICDMNLQNNNTTDIQYKVIPVIRDLLIKIKKEYNLTQNQLKEYYTDANRELELPKYIIPENTTYNYLLKIINS